LFNAQGVVPVISAIFILLKFASILFINSAIATPAL
jgi:hypothetical protein